MRILAYYPVLLFILIGCSSSTDYDKKNNTLPIHPNNYMFGIPVDADDSDDFIIERDQYILSYNQLTGQPNWVSWYLVKEDYGDAPRKTGNFLKDPLVPNNMFNPVHDDYTNSGLDRGHMVRSKERTRTEEDNRATFYMTNIIPQSPNLNRSGGAWYDLEQWCEHFLEDNTNKAICIVSGPIITTDSTIKGVGKVAYPDSCFKMLIVLDKDITINDVTKDNIQVYAVIMPNIADTRYPWENYRRSIDDVEFVTGYDFFSDMPKVVQEVVEKIK